MLLKVIIWVVVKNHKFVSFAQKKFPFTKSTSIINFAVVKLKNAQIVEIILKMLMFEIINKMEFAKLYKNKKENKLKLKAKKSLRNTNQNIWPKYKKMDLSSKFFDFLFLIFVFFADLGKHL